MTVGEINRLLLSVGDNKGVESGDMVNIVLISDEINVVVVAAILVISEIFCFGVELIWKSTSGCLLSAVYWGLLFLILVFFTSKCLSFGAFLFVPTSSS